jgi:hypothetical protein
VNLDFSTLAQPAKKAPITRRVLSYKEKLAFSEWFDDSLEALREAGSSRVEAAAKATKDLGFLVSEGNIFGLEQAKGRTFVAKKIAPLSGHALADMHRQLESAAEALNDTRNRMVEANTRLDLRVSEAFRTISQMKTRMDNLIAALKGQGWKFQE